MYNNVSRFPQPVEALRGTNCVDRKSPHRIDSNRIVRYRAFVDKVLFLKHQASQLWIIRNLKERRHLWQEERQIKEGS